MAEKNLQFWIDHPALKPFVQKGVLDFALFDAANPAPLLLRNAGTLLDRDTVANPLVLIATYVLDSIPHDSFHVGGQRLEENRVAVLSSQPEPDPSDPEILKRLTLDTLRRETTSDYYEDAEFNRILEDCRLQFNDTGFNFPVAALGCLRFFRELSRGRLMLLTSDSGYRSMEAPNPAHEARFSPEGYFWSQVNFDAIGRYCVNAGGRVLSTTYRYTDIDTLVMLFGNPGNSYAETGCAFHEHVEKAGPGDYSNTRRNSPPDPQSLDLDAIVSYLRFNLWDSNSFCFCFKALYDKLQSVDDLRKPELLSTINQVHRNYYYLGEEPDVIFMLGMMLMRLGAYTQAIEYFKESMSPSAKTPAYLQWVSSLERSFGAFHGMGRRANPQ